MRQRERLTHHVFRTRCRRHCGATLRFYAVASTLTSPHVPVPCRISSDHCQNRRHTHAHVGADGNEQHPPRSPTSRAAAVGPPLRTDALRHASRPPPRVHAAVTHARSSFHTPRERNSEEYPHPTLLYLEFSPLCFPTNLYAATFRDFI